jgi:hypothetical protein
VGSPSQVDLSAEATHDFGNTWVVSCDNKPV